MSKSLYIHTPYNVPFLEELFHLHQKQFEIWLNDSFSEEEVEYFQEMIDSIALVLIDLKVEEINFQDYESISGDSNLKKDLFKKVQTTISFNELPFLESNPFQVTYLLLLLEKLEGILIDPGTLSDLQLKEEFSFKLSHLKKAEDFLADYSNSAPIARMVSPKTFDPIEHLITEIYNELKRLEVSGQLPLHGEDLPDKTKKLLSVMQSGFFTSDDLLKITSLHPKDFDDHLEKLKFYLRKVDS